MNSWATMTSQDKHNEHEDGKRMLIFRTWSALKEDLFKIEVTNHALNWCKKKEKLEKPSNSKFDQTFNKEIHQSENKSVLFNVNKKTKDSKLDEEDW